MFVAFVCIVLPNGTVFARDKGEKVVLVPEVESTRNSQTMNLLEGYHNINPTGIGGPELAIVDETALAPLADDAVVFFDTGLFGTGQISVYVVRKGDTLSSIAKMFGVSVNTIAWANDIKNGKVNIGQELVILPISGVKHTVKQGDTVGSIASKYKADVDDILSYNNLNSNAKIIPGDILIIPDGEVSAVYNIASQGSSRQSNNIAVASGYYLRPINGGRKSQGLHGHNAVDLAAPIGTPIYASADGTVLVSKKSGYNGGYGIYIVISHPNGTQTVYGHLRNNYVSVGQRVSRGETIGTIGMTGKTTGPHVHFEVRGARNPF